MRILSGLYKGRVLKTCKSRDVRPTSSMLRESIFNICRGSLEEGSFLDLFSGTGAMGIEALSRGASQVVFVDASIEAAKVIRENLQTFGIKDSTKVIVKNVFAALKQLTSMKAVFNFIYIDPPYDKAASLVPGVLSLIVDGRLLTHDGIIFVEAFKECLFPDCPGLKKKSFKRAGSSGLTQYVVANDD